MKISARAILKTSLLGLGLVAYSAVAGELFVRLAVPQPVMPRNVEATDAGIRGNIPNIVYRHFTPETDVEFHINSAGMRDSREYTVEKPSGTCRIELFGDSFFMGYELNFPDTIAAQVEKKIKAAGYQVQLLNFAVSGFGTAESLIAFEQNAKKYAPDIVIYEWHSSSFMNNVRSDLYEMSNGDLKRKKDKYIAATGIQSFIDRYSVIKYITENSEIYALLREKLSFMVTHLFSGSRWAETEHLQHTEIGDMPPGVAPPVSIVLSRALMLRARDEAKQAGAEFLAVDIPFLIGDSLRETIDLLHLDTEMPIVKTMQKLLDADKSTKSLFFQRGMGHLTAPGAEIVSSMIAERVMASPKLAACRNGA